METADLNSLHTNGVLNFPLYHGTSTIFLDSIIANGLGAVNPMSDWKVYELCKEVYALSETHLKSTKLFDVSGYSFKRMAEQSNQGAFNFQHGDTYLSASINTAVSYAIDKEYGSELLTYTINFLKELLRLDLPKVKSDLFSKYGKVFGLIEAKPSPVLLQVTNLKADKLTDEHGNDPTRNFETIIQVKERPGLYPILQQANFRLTEPLDSSKIKFYLIDVSKWHNFNPEYNLYEISPHAKKH